MSAADELRISVELARHPLGNDALELLNRVYNQEFDAHATSPIGLVYVGGGMSIEDGMYDTLAELSNRLLVYSVSDRIYITARGIQIEIYVRSLARR